MSEHVFERMLDVDDARPRQEGEAGDHVASTWVTPPEGADEFMAFEVRWYEDGSWRLYNKDGSRMKIDDFTRDEDGSAVFGIDMGRQQ